MNPIEILSSSPAAAWISTKLSEDGSMLIQACLRCGTEETLALPTAVASAFREGVRGEALARQVPPGLDDELFTWKRSFQLTHESCGENRAA